MKASRLRPVLLLPLLAVVDVPLGPIQYPEEIAITSRTVGR